MADDGKEAKKSYSNIFIANTIYPEAKSIFSFRLEPIEKIKDDCYIVLDTNVLIAPYINGGKDNLLEECQKIYSSLVAEKRLIIPSQVAREFAKVRQDKLAELHQQLIRKLAVEPIKKDKYPLLSSLDELKEAGRLAEEINKKIKEYQKIIDKIIASIRDWNWNDPVSTLYHRTFTEETILDIEVKHDDVKKDLYMRKEHDIPPGYKDGTKKDEGIGDLLIWLTILEAGRLYNKSVIFVTGDEKADWYKKSEKYPLYPRYELVDEFRRASGGCSFHMIRFSRFLELFGAKDEIVKLVENDEEKALNTQIHHYSTIARWKHLVRSHFDIAQNKLQVYLDVDYFDIGKFKEELQHINAYLSRFIETAPEEMSDEFTIYLESIIDDVNLLIRKEIYKEDRESMQELISIIGRLITTIDFYSDYYIAP